MRHPVMEIPGAERGRCCVTMTHVPLDVCGRPDCSWPCSSPELKFPPPSPEQEKAFFHETSGVRALDIRQACAIESLALINPNLTIYVLMSGENIDQNVNTMQMLNRYGNIHIHVINLGDYFIKTPLEKWYFCTTWNDGPYAVSHLSDALRFLTLYKFGGYYFDLDIIMLRSVMPYRNFAGAEDKNILAAGALHVDYRHPLIRMAVEEFRTTYRLDVKYLYRNINFTIPFSDRKDIWGQNGPLLLTRVLKKWCSLDKVAVMTADSCYGFEVLPPNTFYPIEWSNWESYFSDKNITWGNDTVGVHVWNKKSSSIAIYKNSSQVYTQLARSKCPTIFAIVPEVF